MVYRNLQVEVTRKRVKCIRLKIKEGKVLVSLPFFSSEKEVFRIIDEHYEWIVSKLNNGKIFLGFLDPVYLLGEKYQLKQIEATRSKVIVNEKDITVYGPSLASRKKAFDKFCEAVLLDCFSTLKQFDVSIKFKNYKAKWGVCYPTKKEVYFNYRVSGMPVEAIEYIYYHEMAHLKVSNHQKEFYQQVQQYLPNYKVGLKKTKQYDA